jgi:hypothetical protein
VIGLILPAVLAVGIISDGGGGGGGGGMFKIPTVFVGLSPSGCCIGGGGCCGARLFWMEASKDAMGQNKQDSIKPSNALVNHS